MRGSEVWKVLENEIQYLTSRNLSVLVQKMPDRMKLLLIAKHIHNNIGETF